MQKAWRKNLVGVLCLSALMLGGCEAPKFMRAPTYQYPPLPDQTKTVEDPTKARIYLMRKEKVFGAGVGVQFYATAPDTMGPDMEGSSKYHLVGEVGPDSFICWEEAPQPFGLELSSGDIKSFQKIDLQAGHVYYLQAYLHTGWVRTIPRIRILTEKEGQEMLKGCRPPFVHHILK